MKPFVLGVDLDGVCADYVDAFRNHVAMKKNVAVSSIPEATNWEFHLAGWPIADRTEYMQLHSDFVAEGGFVMERPMPGVSAALWELSDADIYIRIVTHRLINKGSYARAVIDTTRWLETYNIPFRGLCFERHKGDTGADLYIDDSPTNIEELRSAGKRAIVFDAPYNREVGGERVRSWSELVPIVLQAAKEA